MGQDRATRRHGMAALLGGLAAGLGAGAHADSGGPAGMIDLSLSGAPGVAVTLDCRLEGDGGAERVTLSPDLPFETRFRARALDCTIESEGRVEATLRHGGNVTRSAQSGGRMRLRVR